MLPTKMKTFRLCGRKFIALKETRGEIYNKAIAITIEIKCHDLRDEVGGLKMVGGAHRSSNSAVGLEKPYDVPKLSFCMEVVKIGIDLHDEKDEKKRQYEEGEDHHHKEELDEFGGHGHSCGHCCGQIMTGYGLIISDLLHLLFCGGRP